MYREKKTKSVENFEKLDYGLKNAALHLKLLLKRKHGNPIPKYLRFHLPIKSFQSSETYQQCQLKLLDEEIRYKKCHIQILKRKYQNVRNAF